MTFKLGTLLLLAASAATMSAQTPVAVQDIYSQTGVGKAGDTTVVYSFGNWHGADAAAESNITAFSALFDEMISTGGDTLIGGVIAEADGIEVSWNSVEKLITVNCGPDKLGRTTVLIADMNGATRGMVTVNDNPAQISISNHVPGTYAVAVAVDGKLVKTFKIILK